MGLDGLPPALALPAHHGPSLSLGPTRSLTARSWFVSGCEMPLIPSRGGRKAR